MDQSASVMGLEGGALYIKFTPSLDATPVFFPKCNPEFNFVIAKSYVQADKHTTGPVNYNLRVVETTLAAKVLAKKHDLVLPDDAGPLGCSLRGFQDAYFAQQGAVGYEEQLTRCIEIVKKELVRDEGYTREEITEILDTSVVELTQKYMTRFPGTLRNSSLALFFFFFFFFFFASALTSSSPHNSSC